MTGFPEQIEGGILGEQSWRVELSAPAQAQIINFATKLPSNSPSIEVNVPIVEYRGLYRASIGGVREGLEKWPFILGCRTFSDTGIEFGVELRQHDDHPLGSMGRPIAGYCGVFRPPGSFYGDQYSKDGDITGIRAYVNRWGAALMIAETSDGNEHPVAGLEASEVCAFTTICIGVYDYKIKQERVK